ncbi:NUDIX hydrolase [Pelagivirga sediminicola]|uniref:NUDIX hydrolase n=1 Tax=Pelagivirga sediminicola TaxID=2170575 RepID=A0A2T7G7P9_9RHOB|nr:NUDIX hydrolase [Pelagivirga sediminicola]PVA10443.1 NUDIX hydrolase [Pelagivirga sediminicola]
MDSENTAPTAHIPIDLSDAGKSDLRTQFAALCYRMRRGKPEVLLITSRGSGRWIVPKGWPMDGKTPMQSAEIEAWEEAGVRGRIHPRCLGLYYYHKSVPGGADLPCVAMVYALKVREVAADFPEAGQRKRKWLRPKKAAALVDEPELAHMIRKFDPARAGG